MTVRRRRAARGSGELLGEQILDAATELMLAGVTGKELSIRSVAQKVGVTPPSIYLHFADKDALLDAVCARYFERLHDEMQRAAEGKESTLDVLAEQGLAYIRFAVSTPELYRIATMGEGRPASDVDATLASSAFVYMRDSVQKLMDEGIYPPGDPVVVALELWAAAHGVAALLISKPYLPFGDPLEFASRILRACCTGHMVAGILGPNAGPDDTVEWLFALKGDQP
jgi:AcrR family transcriptional regulator